MDYSFIRNGKGLYISFYVTHDYKIKSIMISVLLQQFSFNYVTHLYKTKRKRDSIKIIESI